MAAPAGWFGKLPCCGDFASRRLDAELVRRLDGWLSRSMRLSRAQHGEAWLRSYLAARVVCFAWRPGVVDDRWWCGVLVPSCDNVGRYFPLIVLQACARPPHEAADHARLRSWHARHGAATLRVLDDDVSLDDFERALQAAAAPDQDTPDIALDNDPADWQRALDDMPAAGTAWWFHDAADAGVVVHPALPGPEAFMQLLDQGSDDTITTA